MFADVMRRAADEPPIFVEVPGPCDLACAWCNIGGVAAVPGAGDLARISARLEALAADGRRTVGLGFHHTEPTTHPDVVEVARRARALGFERITLATSGLAIADRAVLRSLIEAGVTDVTLTFATLDPRFGDVVLGVGGATEAKLRALDACLDEDLAVCVMLMLLRPTLHRVADDVASLAERFRRAGGRRTRRPLLHGCLMDRSPEFEPDRLALLWPGAGEVAWASRRARARVPGFRIHARDLPLCLAERIPGVRARPFARPPGQILARPDPACEACERVTTCAGFSREYPRASLEAAVGGQLAEIEPPPPDLGALARALEPRRRSSISRAEPAADPAWQRAALRRLEPLLGGRRLSGFAAHGARRDDRSITLEMATTGGATFEVIVEDAAVAPRSFVAGRRYAVSYRAGTPPGAAGETLLRAVLEILERPLGGRRA